MKTEKELLLIENNTLIAKFMDAKVIHEYSESMLLDYVNKEHYPNNERYHSNTCLKYNSSWDWLHPVVTRIEQLGFRFIIGTKYVRVHTCKNNNFDNYDEYNCEVFGGKFNTTYHAIVEFINWYKDKK